MKKGTLFLVPSLLSDENPGVIPHHTLHVLFSLDHFIVENEKSARHFLKAVKYPKPLQEITMHLLNEHTKQDELEELFRPLLSGVSMGIISEAGCPAVADPGSGLVKMAHEKKVEVIPLTGPSSLLLALMSSGLNGQRFAFAGYLPKEKTDRIRVLRELEKRVTTKNETQIFIEAPYRNQHLLEDILQTCSPSTLLCLAVDLTSDAESVQTKFISEWKKNIPDIQKRQVVFLLGK